jgi:predicted PurR-regulated permease PerM
MYLMHKVVELIVPDQYEPQVFRVLRLTRTAFSNFLTGQMIEALVIGTLCTIGLLIFRFPYAVTIGLLTGFTTLLPIIGAWIGGAVGLLLIWVDSPEKAIWFLIFILALQQIDGQFIYPKIVGDSIGLPGLLVLIAVIIGGGFAGIMGIILAVPIFAIGYALLKDAIDNMPPKKTKPVVETPAPEPEESDEENEET